MAPDFTDFEEFFPWYVGQHSKQATRWIHFAGIARQALSPSIAA